jgi:hypothetical protein
MEFYTIYVTLTKKAATIISQNLLKILFDIDSKLNGIESKLSKIQKSTYVAGINLPKKANRADSEQMKLELIKQASYKFDDAASQNDFKLNAVAYFFSGCCYDILGQTSIAFGEYESAFQEACRFEQSEQESSADRSKLTNRIKLSDAGLDPDRWVCATTLAKVGARSALSQLTFERRWAGQ